MSHRTYTEHSEQCQAQSKYSRTTSYYSYERNGGTFGPSLLPLCYHSVIWAEDTAHCSRSYHFSAGYFCWGNVIHVWQHPQLNPRETDLVSEFTCQGHQPPHGPKSSQGLCHTGGTSQKSPEGTTLLNAICVSHTQILCSLVYRGGNRGSES